MGFEASFLNQKQQKKIQTFTKPCALCIANSNMGGVSLSYLANLPNRRWTVEEKTQNLSIPKCKLWWLGMLPLHLPGCWYGFNTQIQPKQPGQAHVTLPLKLHKALSVERTCFLSWKYRTGTEAVIICGNFKLRKMCLLFFMSTVISSWISTANGRKYINISRDSAYCQYM